MSIEVCYCIALARKQEMTSYFSEWIIKLIFYLLKIRNKNKYKYFPFQNIHFLNVLTFVKIVPIYNTSLLERAHISTLPLVPFRTDTPLHFAPLNICSLSYNAGWSCLYPVSYP